PVPVTSKEWNALALAETQLHDEADGCETLAARAPVPGSGGVLRLALKRRGDATVLDRLYQSGCLKARLFRLEPRHCAEVVLLNTSGGIVGGDRLSQDIDWGPGTHAVVTTPACEK